MAFHVSLCAREKKSERRINTKTLVFTIALLAGLVMAGSTGAWAQCPASPAFTPDFSNNQTCLTLNGSAAFGAPASTLEQPPSSNPPQAPPPGVNTVLRLTPNRIFVAGSAWWNVPFPVNQHFSTTFTFQMSGANTNLPGDGIAFVIQHSPQALNALDADNGADGCSIGFGQTASGICTPNSGGIPNSLAVEFDAYQNTEIGDVSANHVAIQSCGTGPNSVDSNCRKADHDLTNDEINLANGSIHTATITYTPPPTNCLEGQCLGFLDVILDGTDLFPNGVQFDMTSLGLGDGGIAYVGFTGATGGADDNHDILSWTFAPDRQTITQPAPAGTTTTYLFGTYLYKVKPDQDIDHLAVTAVLTDPDTFATHQQHANFGNNVQCIVYSDTAGKCVEFHAVCTSSNNACSNVNYDVATSYDVPTTTPITNPGFLKATDQDCVAGIMFDSNIITQFLQTRNDPTTKGSSRPSFSCFVAVQNVTYSPADLDIVNLPSSKAKQGYNLTYVATTTNFGPSGAQGVFISNTIPGGTTYVSSSLCSLGNGCSSDRCTFAAGTASCSVGNLDKFGLEFMLVTVQVTAKPGTILSDTATISAFNPDPDRKPDRSWTTKITVTSK
jgi:uncharacterized repeat protein (TIGR01451 family)